MTKKLLLIAALAALAIGSSAAPLRCGIKPLKPLNCKDAVASCVCSADGKRCSWVWTCR